MGIEDVYVAYCFDQAVSYLGSVIEGELNDAGHKPSKDEGQIRFARERVYQKYFGDAKEEAKGFADPAALFGS